MYHILRSIITFTLSFAAGSISASLIMGHLKDKRMKKLKAWILIRDLIISGLMFYALMWMATHHK